MSEKTHPYSATAKQQDSSTKGVFNIPGLILSIVVDKLQRSEACSIKLIWDEKRPEKIERTYALCEKDL